MTPEKLFHELLGLGLNWEVIESRFERETGTVFLEIRETAHLWELTRCPKEGGLVFCYDHTELLTWRHLNVFQHRCEITCRLPRGQCRQCGHVFRVRPPWEGLSSHFTKEFEAFALLLMREMPVSGVAEHCRHAQVVFDKFHVIQNATQAVDKVRQAEIQLGGAEVWESLHKTQWIWRKNRANLTARQSQKLAKIEHKNLATAKAYQMRLVLQDIYRLEDVHEARHRFRVWCRWVRWVAYLYEQRHKPFLFVSMLK